ncbi:hypothetical protein YC2023_083101 [Brassica napus]
MYEGFESWQLEFVREKKVGQFLVQKTLKSFSYQDQRILTQKIYGNAEYAKKRLRRWRNTNYDDECWRSNGFERMYSQREEAQDDVYVNGRNDQMKIEILMKNPISPEPRIHRKQQLEPTMGRLKPTQG